jgi:nicotinamidase-related amidase
MSLKKFIEDIEIDNIGTLNVYRNASTFKLLALELLQACEHPCIEDLDCDCGFYDGENMSICVKHTIQEALEKSKKIMMVRLQQL